MTSVGSHGGSLLLIVMKNCFNTQGNPTALFEWYLQQHTGTHAHLQVFKLQLGTLSFLAGVCNYVGIAVPTKVKG
ncbi:unnamed protein product [Sphagnum jensenii]